MKTILILEGGAMRGLYTAGVLDVLLDHPEIRFDAVAGVSAGALFGINYKSRQRDRARRYNVKYCDDEGYFSMRSYVKTGDLMNREFCFDKLPNELDPFDYDAYREDPVAFYAVVTNLLTGRSEYPLLDDLKKPDQMEFLRASGSLPFLSRPVMIDHVPYLDGGVADSIPVKHFLDAGFDRAVVVLTRPKGYRKSGLIAGAHLKYPRYPFFADALMNRNLVYNRTCDEVESLENNGTIFVLRPSRDVGVKRTESDRNKLQELYEVGTSDSESNLSALMNYLNS